MQPTNINQSSFRAH